MDKFFLPGAVAALAGLAALSPAHAAAPATQAADQEKIADLEQKLQRLSDQLQNLERAGEARHGGTEHPRPSDATVSLAGGRPTFTSADGRFSVAFRGLIQYDQGTFAQGKAPAGTDLSSGGNFRRAQIGLQGTAFSDWSYNFVYDFGGSGTEKSGYIYTAYAQYDGLKPFGLRIGAYAPPAGIEDATSSGDLIFAERPASADIARNIAGSPSRNAVTLFYAGDRLYGALSYTGDKITDPGTFDEQQALVGRLSYLAYSDADTNILLDANATHVFKLADNAAGGASNPTTSFSITPEVTFDSGGTKFVNTGNIPAASMTQWGLEGAANYRNFYAQGGYFDYAVARPGVLDDPHFAGWYVTGTFVLTGESRRYNAATATFQNPRPTGAWGAWEIAARYSSIDLNYRAGLAGSVLPAGGIRGGDQTVWGVGLNWYPNTVFHFALDYDDITVGRLDNGGADIGLAAQALVLRTQVSF